MCADLFLLNFLAVRVSQEIAVMYPLFMEHSQLCAAYQN